MQNAFEPSSLAAPASGPKQRDAGRAQRVGDAGHQRCFRADHHQRHAEQYGQARDRLRIVDVDAVDDLGIGRDPRVARGAEQLRRARRTGERLHERVLTGAAAEHEHAIGGAGHGSARIRHATGYSEPMKSSIGIAVSVS